MFRLVLILLPFFSSCELGSTDESFNIYIIGKQEGWGAIVFNKKTNNKMDLVLDSSFIVSTSANFNNKIQVDGVNYYRFYRVIDGDTIPMQRGTDKTNPNCVNSFFVHSLNVGNGLVKCIQFHVGELKDENIHDSNSEYGKFETRLQDYIR